MVAVVAEAAPSDTQKYRVYRCCQLITSLFQSFRGISFTRCFEGRVRMVVVDRGGDGDPSRAIFGSTLHTRGELLYRSFRETSGLRGMTREGKGSKGRGACMLPSLAIWSGIRTYTMHLINPTESKGKRCNTISQEQQLRRPRPGEFACLR